MSEKKKITENMRKALRAPFPDEAYKPIPAKTYLTTLKAMYGTERLNDVFGVGRWIVNHEVVERTTDYVLILGKFESLDYDVHVTPQYGGHKTTGSGTETADGFKSAVTDCQSKIASYLEIGIDMFKGNVNAKGGTKKTESPFKKSPEKPIYKPSKPWLNIGKGNWDAIVVDITKADKAKGEEILVKVKAKYQMADPTLEALQKLIK